MAVIALKCPHINVTVVDANPDKIKAWNGPLENYLFMSQDLLRWLKRLAAETCSFLMTFLEILKKRR
jgi:hypothetical protein